MLQHRFTSSIDTPSAAAPTSDGEGLTHLSTTHLINLHHYAEQIRLGVSRIRSLQSGSYRSHFRGRGMEFDEVRPYQAGDDIRTMEWPVTGRTGKPHTKLFCEERERAILLCVDLRQSMMFATRGAFKSVRACTAAALLGWSAEQGRDRIGGLIFSDHQHQEFRPRNGKPALIHLLKGLADHPAWKDKGDESENQGDALTQALTRVRRVASSGSLIFILSDFSQFSDRDQAQIAHLSRHNEVVLIFIYDPVEQSLPPAGLYRIRVAKQEMVLDTQSPAQRQAHEKQFEQRMSTLQALAKRPNVNLLSMPTTDDPIEVLSQYFRA